MLNLKKLFTKVLDSQHKQFKVVEISVDGTALPANSVFVLTFQINAPAGYTPLCLRGYNLSRINGFCISRLTMTSSNISIGGYNNSSTQVLNGLFYVLCVNNGINN